jgi:subtilisin-like proprotein convertase family protein
MKKNTRNIRSAWVLAASLLLSMSALGQYSVTQPGPIAVIDNAVAAPYPCSVYLTNANLLGVIQKVTVEVDGVTHPYAPDIGLLLVGPGGRAVVLMSGSGGNPIGSAALDKANLTFSDDATASLPVASPLVSGAIYKPADNANLGFPSPAPSTGYATTLTGAFGGRNPNGVWSLYVLDDTPGPVNSGTATIGSWKLNLYTTPLLALGTNSVYLAENGNAVTMNFIVADSSPPAAGFTATAGNDATNVVSAIASVTGTNGTLTITPRQNTFGTNTLTLSISDGFSSAQADLTVNVSHVNQAPTLAITNSSVSTLAGIVSPIVNVTVGDVDPNNPPTGLSITVASSDTNIVAPSGVFFSTADTGALRKFSVVPKGTNTGSATLTFTVVDPGGLSNSASILVNVGPVAHPAFANARVLGLADSGTTNSSIAVSNVPGMIGNVTVSVDGLKNIAGDNLSLALVAPGGTVTLLNNSGAAGPNTFAQATFAGNGAASLPGSDSISGLTLQAAGLGSLVGKSPIGIWTLWATNGGAGAQVTGGWVLNIYAAPTISSTLTNISMPEETSTNISFAVTGINGSVTNASDVTITSGNTDLITIVNPAFDLSTGIGSAQLQAIFKTTGPQFGSTTVTVTAKDNNNFTVSFVYNVTVTFVNHAPQITYIPRQVTRVGDVLGPVPFGVSDPDLPPQALTVTASSDNQALLPDSNILLQGGGNNLTFTIFPIGTISGTANVTLTVSDGKTNTSTIFSMFAQSQGNPLFANQKQVSVPANAPADTYPTTIGVSNLIGTISDVQVSLFDITHSAPDDLNVLLVSPQGVKVLVMGHAGGANALANTSLVFADEAANNLPDNAQIISGTYKPSSYGTVATFPTPAPTGPYATALSAFNGLNGTNANGLWTLYVVDSGTGKGVIVNGWQLSIQTAVSVQTIADVTMRENDKTLQIPVSVGDDQPGVNISVSATPADPTVVQTVFELGSGGTRTLDVTPVPYHTGSNILVTVTAQAGAQSSSSTFHVTVYPVNLPPVATVPSNISTPAASPSPVTTFTAWDPQDAPLSVTAVSSDTKLIPNGNITIIPGTVVGQTNTHSVYQFGVSVQPAGILTGPATITLTVNDAAGQSTPVSFSVTVTPALVFQNTDGPISIPSGYPIASNATPFPSVINVSGVKGAVTGARVTLQGLSHQFPQDVDVLLVSPDSSKSVILMAHAGGSTAVNNIDVSFADGSPSLPVGSSLSKGTFAPSSYAGSLRFGAGAPTTGYSTNLSSLVGVSPNGAWKLYVMDDSYPLNGSIGGWLLSLQTGPAFDMTTIGPKNTPENTPAVITFNVFDDSMDPAALVVTASTNGTVPTNVVNLIASLQVTNNGGGARTLIAYPSPNLPSSVTNVDATATIVLTVTDTNNASASTTFPLTVSFGNQKPVAATPTNTIWMVENQATPATVVYTLSDVDSTLYLSNLVVRSTDPLLIPNDTNHIVVTLSTNRIVQGATGTVTLEVTPAVFAFGTNTVTVAINDGASTTATPVTFNVRFSAQGPIISGLPSPCNSPAGCPTAIIPFTVSSPEGVPTTRLTVTATSQNQALVPNANIVLGGSADTRTIQLTPLGTVSGQDRITLAVGDGSKTNSFPFDVTFTAPPVTLFGNGQVVNIIGTTNPVNSSVYPITFDVTNLVGSIHNVSLEMRGFSNSAPANFDALLVSPDGIAVMLMSGAGGSMPVNGLDVVLDDSGATMQGSGPLTNGTYHPAYYTKRLLPAPAPQDSYQTRLSAFSASTSVNGTWQLFVNDLTPGDLAQISGGIYLSVVTKPTIQITSPIPVTIPENGSTVVNFIVNDATISTTNLTVSATSDNAALLPAVAPNVVIKALAPGTNNNFSATLAPVQYVNGAVNLSLVATRADGASTIAVVSVTVTATNIPPVISRLIPQVIPENGTTNVEFLVSDADSPLRNLTVQAISDNQSVIANSNLTFVGYGTNFVNGLPLSSISQVSDLILTINPNSYAIGSANISIVVTDTTTNGVNTVSSILPVTVPPVIYPPTLSAIPDQTLTAGSNILVGFTVTSQNQGSPTLAVTATSSDQTLVKNAKLTITPASAAGVANRTLQITAEQNARGSATITLTAVDTSNGNVSTVGNFKLTVLPTPIHNFATTAQITIPDVGPAAPYPSQLSVSGLMGTISRATVTLNGFSHLYPNDVGILMVSPTGQKIVLMDRAGGGNPVTNANLTFDPAAASAIPQGTLLTNGTYKPASYNTASFDYPSPAPVHPYSTDLTTLNSSVPNGIWSLYVVDQSPPDHGAISNGWSLTFTTQPTVNGLQNMVINENTSGNQPFTVGDDSPSGPSFRFGVSSTNTTLIPNNAVTFSGAGTNFQVNITPTVNRFGTNYVTVYVTNIDNMVASSSFLVTVPQVIQAPFIAPIADTNVAAGGVASIAVNYGDIQVSQNQLLLSFQSSDLNLVPLKNISLAGNVLQVAPAGAPATPSTVTITMTVKQPAPLNLATNISFKLTVIPTPNLFGNAAGIVINDRAAAAPYPSTINVSNVYGNIVKATVSVRGLAHTYPSDISMLLVGPQGQKIVLMSRAGAGVGSSITNVNLVFDDSASSGPVQSGVITSGTYKPSDYNGSLAFYSPAPAGPYVTNLTALNGTNPNGTWSLWVQDDLSPDSGVISGDWLISFVTSAPLISAIAPQTTLENHALTVDFSVSSVLTSASNITVTATSSGQAPAGLVSNLLVIGPGTNAATSRRLTIVPAANLPSALTNVDGTATITLTATDGTNTSSASFPLTVTFVNQPPSLAGLANVATAANAPLTIHFTANDVDTAAGALTVTSTSSNPGLGALALTSSGNAQTLKFTPSGTTGATVVTVAVSDGQLSATNTFSINVTPAVPPVFAEIADTNTIANVPLSIALSVTGSATAITNLTFTGAGTNAVLVRNVTFAYNGTTEVATINLVTNKIGIDYITITVSDGVTNASQGFVIEVQAPEPVQFGAIADQNTTANKPVTVSLNITSPVVPISALALTGTSSNPALVSGVTFSNDGVKVAATVNLVKDQSGTAVVSIVVNDGFTYVTNSFDLTVASAPVAPTLAIGVKNGQIHISFTGAAGANYGILSSTDLKSWSDTGLTVTTDASGAAAVSAPLPTSAGGTFYRAMVK